MWPVVVEVVAETVKACLLLGRRGGRRARGLRLERGVHALVPAILLRRAGLDPLQANAGLDPLHRQPGQAARAAGRGKRRAPCLRRGKLLSLRIARGRPSSPKACSTTGCTAWVVSGTMRHSIRKRLSASVIVSGSQRCPSVVRNQPPVRALVAPGAGS